MSAFKQVIQNEAELRDILGYAGQAALNKVIPEIDAICRAFIEQSPFVLLGSTDANGSMDVSPKGDPAGLYQLAMSKISFLARSTDASSVRDAGWIVMKLASAPVDSGGNRRLPKPCNAVTCCGLSRFSQSIIQGRSQHYPKRSALWPDY